MNKYRTRIFFFLLILLPFRTFGSISLTDDTGFAIELEQPAQTLISLAPHITELVYAAGAGSKLVGVVSYSNYPPAALEIPVIGSYETISFESVVSLQPDVVLAWQSGNGEKIIDRLRSLGIKVYVTKPRKIEDIAHNLRQIGLLADTTIQAEKAAIEFDYIHQELQQLYSQKPKVDVFYQVWNEPLISLNGEHIISAVMNLCGANNVFAEALTIAPKISVESVIQADPQVILASGMGEARPEWLDEWWQWDTIRAVRNGHLYFIHPDLLQRHTPRILEGAKQMCEFVDKARAQAATPNDAVIQ
ncbi:MAG: cobalamin-binding protein [Pseudomonadales bacterium]